MAGAEFGEIWVRSRSAKFCIFPRKMRLPQRTGGRVMTMHFMFGSCPNRPRTANDPSIVFGKFLLDFGVLFCATGAVFGDVGG